MLAYPILARKRFGGALSAAEIRAVVAGATDSSWSEAQLAAFLMAAAIQGLNEEETHHLTMAMLESGEQWDLASDVPGLVDKHSTGGVGDKVSLILAPLLAACNVPVVMLTGRALGHTAGTADKLDSLPGLNQELDRTRSLAMLDKSHMAIGGRDRRYCSRGPPSLSSSRSDCDRGISAIDYRQHPVQETRQRCRGPGLRRQDR